MSLPSNTNLPSPSNHDQSAPDQNLPPEKPNPFAQDRSRWKVQEHHVPIPLIQTEEQRLMQVARAGLFLDPKYAEPPYCGPLQARKRAFSAAGGRDNVAVVPIVPTGDSALPVQLPGDDGGAQMVNNASSIGSSASTAIPVVPQNTRAYSMKSSQTSARSNRNANNTSASLDAAGGCPKNAPFNEVGICFFCGKAGRDKLYPTGMFLEFEDDHLLGPNTVSIPRTPFTPFTPRQASSPSPPAKETSPPSPPPSSSEVPSSVTPARTQQVPGLSPVRESYKRPKDYANDYVLHLNYLERAKKNKFGNVGPKNRVISEKLAQAIGLRRPEFAEKRKKEAAASKGPATSSVCVQAGRPTPGHTLDPKLSGRSYHCGAGVGGKSNAMVEENKAKNPNATFPLNPAGNLGPPSMIQAPISISNELLQLAGCRECYVHFVWKNRGSSDKMILDELKRSSRFNVEPLAECRREEYVHYHQSVPKSLAIGSKEDFIWRQRVEEAKLNAARTQAGESWGTTLRKKDWQGTLREEKRRYEEGDGELNDAENNSSSGSSYGSSYTVVRKSLWDDESSSEEEVQGYRTSNSGLLGNHGYRNTSAFTSNTGLMGNTGLKDYGSGEISELRLMADGSPGLMTDRTLTSRSLSGRSEITKHPTNKSLSEVSSVSNKHMNKETSMNSQTSMGKQLSSVSNQSISKQHSRKVHGQIIDDRVEKVTTVRKLHSQTDRPRNHMKDDYLRYRVFDANLTTAQKIFSTYKCYRDERWMIELGNEERNKLYQGWPRENVTPYFCVAEDQVRYTKGDSLSDDGLRFKLRKRYEDLVRLSEEAFERQQQWGRGMYLSGKDGYLRDVKDDVDKGGNLYRSTYNCSGNDGYYLGNSGNGGVHGNGSISGNASGRNGGKLNNAVCFPAGGENANLYSNPYNNPTNAYSAAVFGKAMTFDDFWPTGGGTSSTGVPGHSFDFINSLEELLGAIKRRSDEEYLATIGHANDGEFAHIGMNALSKEGAGDSADSGKHASEGQKDQANLPVNDAELAIVPSPDDLRLEALKNGLNLSANKTTSSKGKGKKGGGKGKGKGKGKDSDPSKVALIENPSREETFVEWCDAELKNFRETRGAFAGEVGRSSDIGASLGDPWGRHHEARHPSESRRPGTVAYSATALSHPGRVKLTTNGSPQAGTPQAGAPLPPRQPPFRVPVSPNTYQRPGCFLASPSRPDRLVERQGYSVNSLNPHNSQIRWPEGCNSPTAAGKGSVKVPTSLIRALMMYDAMKYEREEREKEEARRIKDKYFGTGDIGDGEDLDMHVMGSSNLALAAATLRMGEAGVLIEEYGPYGAVGTVGEGVSRSIETEKGSEEKGAADKEETPAVEGADNSESTTKKIEKKVSMADDKDGEREKLEGDAEISDSNSPKLSAMEKLMLQNEQAENAGSLKKFFGNDSSSDSPSGTTSASGTYVPVAPSYITDPDVLVPTKPTGQKPAASVRLGMRMQGGGGVAVPALASGNDGSFPSFPASGNPDLLQVEAVPYDILESPKSTRYLINPQTGLPDKNARPLLASDRPLLASDQMASGIKVGTATQKNAAATTDEIRMSNYREEMKKSKGVNASSKVTGMKFYGQSHHAQSFYPTRAERHYMENKQVRATTSPTVNSARSKELESSLKSNRFRFISLPQDDAAFKRKVKDLVNFPDSGSPHGIQVPMFQSEVEELWRKAEFKVTGGGRKILSSPETNANGIADYSSFRTQLEVTTFNPLNEAYPELAEKAIIIQSIYRGNQERKELKEMQEKTTKIQAAYRGKEQRKELEKKRNGKNKVSEEFKEQIGGKIGEGSESRKEVEENAKKIQAVYRGKKDRKKVEKKKKELNDKASRIQAMYRGKTERKELRERREGKREGRKRENNKNGKSSVKKGSADPKKKGAASASSSSKKNQTKNSTASSEKPFDLTDPEARKSVTKIQASFRGQRTRRNLKEQKSAIAIQSRFRGKKARQQVQAKRETLEQREWNSATYIQAGFRGRQTRKKYTVKLKKQTDVRKLTPGEGLATGLVGGESGLSAQIEIPESTLHQYSQFVVRRIVRRAMATVGVPVRDLPLPIKPPPVFQRSQSPSDPVAFNNANRRNQNQNGAVPLTVRTGAPLRSNQKVNQKNLASPTTLTRMVAPVGFPLGLTPVVNRKQVDTDKTDWQKCKTQIEERDNKRKHDALAGPFSSSSSKLNVRGSAKGASANAAAKIPPSTINAASTDKNKNDGGNTSATESHINDAVDLKQDEPYRGQLHLDMATWKALAPVTVELEAEGKSRERRDRSGAKRVVYGRDVASSTGGRGMSRGSSTNRVANRGAQRSRSPVGKGSANGTAKGTAVKEEKNDEKCFASSNRGIQKFYDQGEKAGDTAGRGGSRGTTPAGGVVRRPAKSVETNPGNIARSDTRWGAGIWEGKD